MLTEKEMLDMILETADADARIRAVTMEGSRANPNAVHDEYSDFDITFFVTDVREFTRDKEWIHRLGDILIVQCPTDWYSHPYDYNSRDPFAFLIQFADGNRIDLTLRDVGLISGEAENKEPRIVLLNKDNFPSLLPIESEEAYFIQPPGEMEFYNTCNEFRWLCLYVAKGVCRKELYYSKHAYDVLAMPMFLKMLNWKVGIGHNFQVSTGSSCKYLKRFLSEEEMVRFQGIFPGGDYGDISRRLFLMYDYFDELAGFVAEYFGFVHDVRETCRVRRFLEERLCGT